MPRHNTNCLAGIKCPKCGSLGPIDILMPVWVRWTDEGTSVDVDEISQDWNPYEGTRFVCVECGYSMNSIEPFEEKDEDEEEEADNA